MAHLMWPEVTHEYQAVFSELEKLAGDLGHAMTPLALGEADPQRWIEADGYLLRYTGSIDQEPLQDMFQEALRSGRRLLVISTADANAWLDEQFGMSVLSDRHFDLDRSSDPRWAGERVKDRVVSRPATASAAIDSLLDGVERVVMTQPHVVRTFDSARPFLQVVLAHLVTNQDTRRPPQDVADVDRCVAAYWAPPGSQVPQVLVFGDGTWLVDGELRHGDNRQLAINLMSWLGGGKLTRREFAARSGDLLDEIELELAALIVGHLESRLGSRWPDALPPKRLAKVRERRPDADIRSALDLSDKVEAIFHDGVLFSEVGQVGARSKNKSKQLWSRIVAKRHMIRHPERLADLDPTQGQTLLSDLEELVAHLHAARARWQASLDNDPRA